MRKLLIGNWKMNPPTPKEAEELFSTVKKSPGSPDVEVVITPPSIYIPLFKDRGISLGSQNIHYEEKGAFTGEISAKMAESSGCKYAIIGHSERRNIFKETNEDINKKVKSALDNNLVPIICVGENKEEKNNGETGKVIKKQMQEALKEVEEPERLIIGYEPIWAIGSGSACKPEIAFKMRLLIKKTIAQMYSRDFAEKVMIVYGGSVNLGNCSQYTKEAQFDGLLVGGASLTPNKFSKMIREI
ncbi:MAG: triose-phosphate isomerase [Patescibacteria group bacterium]